ncbi:MAG: YibE/F family protein [Candidatus Dojkabacteria bacterium]
MDRLRKNLNLDSLVTILVVIFLLGGSLLGVLSSAPNRSNIAEVVNLIDLVEDGGFFYQNVEARLDGTEQFINLRVQVKDLNLEEIKIGDRVYVNEVDSSIGTLYSFSGHNRETLLFWVVMIFLAFMLVILGRQGFKYVIPTLIIFTLTFSGSLVYLLSNFNIFVASFVLLGFVAFISMLIHLRNVKLAAIVGISQLLTLFIILMINLLLFKSTFLTELFYTNISFLESRIALVEFWSIINAAVLFVAFGATLNTTLDVVQGILKKKQTYPSTNTINLIREGTAHNQIAIARVINSLFFVFLGISLVHIMIAGGEGSIPFWEDPFVVQSLLLFINASIAALLIGPITAVIASIALTSEENGNLQFNLSNGKDTRKKKKRKK